MVKEKLQHVRKDQSSQLPVENEIEKGETAIEDNKPVTDRKRSKKAVDYSILAVEINDEIYINPSQTDEFLNAYGDFIEKWKA